jgi:hypothetical protein
MYEMNIIVLTELMNKVIGMLYIMLGCIGAIVMVGQGEMFPPNIKKSPNGETLEQKDGGTRGKYSQ